MGSGHMSVLLWLWDRFWHWRSRTRQARPQTKLWLNTDMGGQPGGGHTDVYRNSVHATAFAIEYEWVNEYGYLFTFLILHPLSYIIFLQGYFSNFITFSCVFCTPSAHVKLRWCFWFHCLHLLNETLILSSVCIKEHGGKGSSRWIIWTFTTEISFLYKQHTVKTCRGA